MVLNKKINFPHPFHQWFMRTTIGSHLTPGREEVKALYCLDYFLLLFSPNQIIQMTLYTSQQLVKHGEKGTTKGEMIKSFGIIIRATCFEFVYRASLWSNVSQSKYRSAPYFGKTSMNRHHLDMLWRHVRWSHQPYVQDEGTSH